MRITLNEENLERAVKMYASAEYSLAEIFRETGVTREKLYSYLRSTHREGEIVTHRSKKTSIRLANHPQAAQVQELTEAGWNDKEIAQHLSLTRRVINSIRHYTQGTFRDRYNPPGQKVKHVAEAKLNEIIAAFKEKRLNLQQAASEAGVTKPTMRRWLIEMRVIDERWRETRRPNLPEEILDLAVSIYQEVGSIAETLRQTGLTRAQLSNELNKRGLRLTHHRSK